MGEAASSLRLTVRRQATSRAVAVSVEVPADVRYIEEAVELMTRHCLAGTADSRRTAFRLRVLLAEALTNSILFGAGSDATRSVRVAAELTEQVIRLQVADGGDGFDPGGIPDPTTPEGVLRSAGRGLFLIRSLADQVEFNEQGNTIWMTLARS